MTLRLDELALRHLHEYLKNTPEARTETCRRAGLATMTALMINAEDPNKFIYEARRYVELERVGDAFHVTVIPLFHFYT